MCVEYSSRDLPHSENKHLLWDGIYLLAHDAQYDSFFHPAQKKTDKQMKMEPSNRYRIKLKTLVLTLSKFTRIRYVTIFQYKLFGCHINYIWYLQTTGLGHQMNTLKKQFFRNASVMTKYEVPGKKTTQKYDNWAVD